MHRGRRQEKRTQGNHERELKHGAIRLFVPHAGRLISRIPSTFCLLFIIRFCFFLLFRSCFFQRNVHLLPNRSSISLPLAYLLGFLRSFLFFAISSLFSCPRGVLCGLHRGHMGKVEVDMCRSFSPFSLSVSFFSLFPVLVPFLISQHTNRACLASRSLPSS